MNVVALAGGTGSAKLLRGLAATASRLKVVANVGDNLWVHGLYVCPDVDIATYTLAGISDRRGWGIRGDRFAALEQLAELGEETWFRLGDRDLAISLFRTGLLKAGLSLTEITARLGKALGVRQEILPATDMEVETWLSTHVGTMHLQDYWVKNRGRPRVKGVVYRGASRARPTESVVEAMGWADRVLICPANPITSVGPTLAIRGMRRLISRCKGRVVALSPMVGRRPFSGPAGRMMRQLGMRPDSLGIAELYADVADALVVDTADSGLMSKIRALDISCTAANTLMRSPSDERRVASALLSA